MTSLSWKTSGFCLSPRSTTKPRPAVCAVGHSCARKSFAAASAMSVSTIPGMQRIGGNLKVFEQSFDVIEFDLRAGCLTETAAKFFENAAGALHVNLARRLYRDVVAVIAAAQRPAERIGFLLRTRGAVAAGLPRTL